MLIEEIKNIKSSKKELREFALTVGSVLAIFGALAWWRHKGFYPFFIGGGLGLIAAGFLIPSVLKPIQKLWMGLALVMGAVMSRVILSILFYLVLTPLGLAARLAGKQFLDLKFKEAKTSYWIERPRLKKVPADYEKQF